jgi:hypothetical protein
MDLRSLIETHLDPVRLAKDLDEVGHWARVWSVSQWTRKDMAVLWEAARGMHLLSLDDLVPPEVPPLVEVIHDGKNSLSAFTRFQKRFCRPRRRGASESLFGYNHQPLSAVTGPGYYVAHPSAAAGEVDIDYTMLPSEKPNDWPAIVPNRVRLGRFVFDGMVDVLRGLSGHVSIGRARKKDAERGALGEWMDAWFVLVREDPRPGLLVSPS